MTFLQVTRVCCLVCLLLFTGLIFCKNNPVSGDKTPAAPVGMKLIAAGTFAMGSTTGMPNEAPVHNVTVSSFYIDSTEVTQKAYFAAMGKNPSKNKDTVLKNSALLPVDNVTWFEAALFCNARSKANGKDTVYKYTEITSFGLDVDTCVKDLVGLSIDLSKNGFRLPTEAQWEYACRAGTTTDFITGSNDTNGIGAYAWWFLNASDKSHPVATKQPNAWGLYDMIGNVWEWCNNWWYDYTVESQTDPVGPAEGMNRVQRGGMYTPVSGGYSFSASLRSANREGKYPETRSKDRGFRCVCPSK
jgi:formylglycine-generating enzyme required for sulfatase activity